MLCRASTSALPSAIPPPPRMRKRHSIAVSADDDYADYREHNLRHVDALHGDLLYLPADATAAKVVYSHETLAMCLLCIVAGVGAVAPAALIVDQEPSAMQLVMLGNYLYMIAYSLVVKPRVLCDHEIPIRTHLRLVVAQFAYIQGQNIAFRLGMPMSIVLVLKNGGLVAQMLVGTCLLGERFHVRQILAAVAVTVGIVVSVRGDAPADGAASAASSVLLPTAILVFATLLRSLGNEWTKQAFSAHGRLFNEVLFFQHFLGLPLVCSEPQLLINTVKMWCTLEPRLWFYLFAHLAGNFVCSQACARVVATSSVLLNLVLTTMRFTAIVLSATLLAKADAPRAGTSLWGGAVLVSLGVVAFATSPSAKSERRPSKAHRAISGTIREDEAEV